MLALRPNSNSRSAPRAGTAGAAVDGGWLAVAFLQTCPHFVAGGLEQLFQLFVFELVGGFEGADLALPQGLAAEDVADAGGHALVEEDLADR